MAIIPDWLNRINNWAKVAKESSIDSIVFEYYVPSKDGERLYTLKNTEYAHKLKDWLRTAKDVIQTHGNADEEPSHSVKIKAVTNLLESGLAIGFIGVYHKKEQADKTHTIGNIYDNSRDNYMAAINNLFNIAREIGIETDEYEKKAREFMGNSRIKDATITHGFRLEDRNRRLRELLSAKAEIQQKKPEPDNLFAHPDTYDPNVSIRDLIGASVAESNAALYVIIDRLIRSNYNGKEIKRIVVQLGHKEHPFYIWDFDEEKLHEIAERSKREYVDEIKMITKIRHGYEAVINRWLTLAKDEVKNAEEALDIGLGIIYLAKGILPIFGIAQILEQYKLKIAEASGDLISKITDPKERYAISRVYQVALSWQV